MLPDLVCRSRGHRWRRRGLLRFWRVRPQSQWRRRGVVSTPPKTVICPRCRCVRTRQPDGTMRYTYPSTWPR